MGTTVGESAAFLVDSPWECDTCRLIARRYARLGKTCSSALAVGGGGGVAAAFLVSGPRLTAAQWLGILVMLQVLLCGQYLFGWLTARTLDIGWVITVAKFLAVAQLAQLVYSIAYFPDHSVAAESSTWWWLVADGAGWALFGILARELFFNEILEDLLPLYDPAVGSARAVRPSRGHRKTGHRSR